MSVEFTEDQYRAWEESVLALGLRPNTFTLKTLLFCYSPEDMDRLRRNEVEWLPPSEKISMYHVGSREQGTVSCGMKKGTFMLPAMDTGGLTNVRVTPGNVPHFVPILRGTPAQILEEWSFVSGRRLVGVEPEDIQSWVNTVPTGFKLGFYSQPMEQRVLVPAQRLRGILNVYPMRIHKEGAPFARDTEDLHGVYASINPLKGFITTNINHSNILNEYFWKMPVTQRGLPRLWRQPFPFDEDGTVAKPPQRKHGVIQRLLDLMRRL